MDTEKKSVFKYMTFFEEVPLHCVRRRSTRNEDGSRFEAKVEFLAMPYCFSARWVKSMILGTISSRKRLPLNNP